MQRCPGFRWNLIGLAGIYEGVLCLLPESSGSLAQKSASRGLYHHFSTLASPQWPFRSRVQHVHFYFVARRFQGIRTRLVKIQSYALIRGMCRREARMSELGRYHVRHYSCSPRPLLGFRVKPQVFSLS